MAQNRDLELDEVVEHRVVHELTERYLADVGDAATRRALEAASVLRRTTRSLLRATLGDAEGPGAFVRLAALPFVENGRDGLVVHEAVQSAVAATLRSTDPDAHREHRRAAWRQLRAEVRTAGIAELWRYTADLLYLIDNPIVREAFFPTDAHRFAVEPARADDAAAVLAIAARHEGANSARLLETWWTVLRDAFHVVRDRDGAVCGFYCMFDPRAVAASVVERDPVTRAWRADLDAAPLPATQQALFLRRWLSAADGEAPSAVQAACWLDVKRTYMELRPGLRRVYTTVVDLDTWAPTMRTLCFRPLPRQRADLDERSYHSAVLDFGPASVDGWLSALVAAELGLHEGGVLDVAARELTLAGRRVALTRLEFEVLRYLGVRAGQAVARASLLKEVWGRRYDGGSNVVDVIIRSLRKKLATRASMIETVPGVGYRFRE